MSTFEVLPAIDLRAGRVVRLRQGDFARETAYGGSPVSTALGFALDGATWLHVVDLEGARAGEPRQLRDVAAIASATAGRTRVELAGGLRSESSVETALVAGAARVAVGTAALRDPGFAAALVERHGPERVVASIDVRDGMALGEGWLPGAPGVRADEAILRLADAGVVTFEVTAIERDGQLEGPDLPLLRRLVRLRRGEIVASGGISSVDDALAVRDLGCAGAIVGRALYEGRVDLPSLLAAVAKPRERG